MNNQAVLINDFSNVVSLKPINSSNQNGDILEFLIRSFLIRKGYRENGIDTGYGFACKYKNEKFKNIKNEVWELDIYLVHPKLWKDGLTIECKWQSSEGSVDEKIPYAVLSLENLPCPGVLLMAGAAHHPGIIDWAKSRAVMQSQLIVINGIDEFLIWGQRNL